MYQSHTFEAHVWVSIHYQPFQYVVMAFTLGDLIKLLEFTMLIKYSAQSNRAPQFVLKYCCLQITAMNLRGGISTMQNYLLSLWQEVNSCFNRSQQALEL